MSTATDYRYVLVHSRDAVIRECVSTTFGEQYVIKSVDCCYFIEEHSLRALYTILGAESADKDYDLVSGLIATLQNSIAGYLMIADRYDSKGHQL